MSLETPECEAHAGSSHARGKRPPAVEINSFSSYPKNPDLRTNIHFVPERFLGYYTDTPCTSRAQEPPTKSVMYFRSGMVHQPSFQVTSQFTATTKDEKQQLFWMGRVSAMVFDGTSSAQSQSPNYEKSLSFLDDIQIKQFYWRL